MACEFKNKGVKCFDCPNRETCIYLNPPKFKPKLYEVEDEIKLKGKYYSYTKDLLSLPTDSIYKHIYKMLLLMSEDFMLTWPEKHELIFLASRLVNTFSGKGGRGKSKERMFAYMCIHILERDGRGMIYKNNEEYYVEKYKLNLPDKEKMIEFVEQEMKRIIKINE
jgi:hypothetical protein